MTRATRFSPAFFALALPLAGVVWAPSGCAMAIRAITHKSVNMDKWDVQTLKMALRSGKHTVCPRETVQLALVADVKHVKRDKRKTLET